MDLAVLRKPEALTMEEALLRLRDGCADQGLRFLTALEPARAGGAPAILTVFVATPLTGGVDLGPEALQAALRVVEATPYAGEPLPTPRPVAAAPPIVPEAAPPSSGPASAVDCTEGAPRELALNDDPRVGKTAAENDVFLCAAFPYGGGGASSSPSDYEESPTREPLMQRRATPSPDYEPGGDDVPTAAAER